jgi:predicted PurR-regulated permease PerM
MTSQEYARSIRVQILFTFALALGLYFAWLIRGVLILLFVSALFAVVLSPAVRATANLQVGRWRPFKGSAAIFFLLLAVAGVLTAFCFLAIPPVLRDLQTLSSSVPNRFPALIGKLQKIPFANNIDTDALMDKVQDSVSQGAGFLLTSAKSWASAIAQILVGLVLTIYFVLEGDQAYQWLLRFFPTEGRQRLDATLQRASVRMGKWLLGQASLMLVFGLTSTIAYLSLHMRYAYALGFLTGLLNVVPVLGATVSLTLALIVAAVDSWGRVLGVGIFFLIYLQIENSLLVPHIMRNRVNLPALAIFIALLLGSALEGVIGAMIAIPTAVLIVELLDEYVVRKDPA